MLEWSRTPSGKESFRKARLKRETKNHEISKNEWKACKDYFNNSCAYCELPADQHFGKYRGRVSIHELHKEHVDCNGCNDISNCVPSCMVCNSEKSNYSLDEWYNADNPKHTNERYNKVMKWITEGYKEYME